MSIATWATELQKVLRLVMQDLWLLVSVVTLRSFSEYALSNIP